MRNLILLFWQLCRFQKGPQDIPESTALFRLSVICYLVASIFINKLNLPWASAITNVLIGAFLLLGFIWILLKMEKKLNRFYASAIALFGVDAFITACSTPFFVAIITKNQPGVAFLFLVLLAIWHWAVMVNILKHALSTSIWISLILATSFHYGSYKFFQLVTSNG